MLFELLQAVTSKYRLHKTLIMGEPPLLSRESLFSVTILYKIESAAIQQKDKIRNLRQPRRPIRQEIGSYGHAVTRVSACQGGYPRGYLLTLAEGSCLLCRFEAKALLREEFGKAMGNMAQSLRYPGTFQKFWK